MRSNYKGLLAVHASVMLFGLTALFSKLIELSALDITFLRSIFAMLAIGALLFWSKQSLSLQSRSDYGIAFGLGALLAIHWVTYFQAMQVSSIAVGVIALFTFPIMTVFMEPILTRERIQLRDVFSACLVLFGIYLLVPEFSIDNPIAQGILWGVFSAFCFALRNVLQGHFFKGNSARHSLFYQTFAAILVLLPFSISIVPEVSAFQWGQLMLLGILLTALPHTLFAFGLLTLKTKTVSLIACVQVVYATTFAALFIGETVNWITYLGGAIVLAVAMYESFATRKPNQVK